MTVRWTDHHLSGFHGASDTQWRRAIRRATDDGAVATFTEARQAPLKESLRPGWEVCKDFDQKGAECAILFREEVFTELESASESVTKVQFRTGKGAVRPGVVVQWGLFEHFSGLVVARMVGHMPASVQHGGGWSDKEARVQAHKDGQNGIRRIKRRLDKKADVVIGSFDFNLDMTREVWEKRVERRTDMELDHTNRGTHGGRAIDAFLSEGPANVIVHLDGPRLPGFDHRLTKARVSVFGRVKP